jgi:hypothetical protein
MVMLPLPRSTGAAMTDLKTLYDKDFVSWTEQQAAALRAAGRTASNQQLDWENLAEEIESLGRSERRELRSQIRRIIQHLLKLEHSPATEPQRGWIESIGDSRSEIEALLEESPSLKNELGVAVTSEFRRAARKAIFELEGFGELDEAASARIHAASYTPDQVLGDWFPPEPQESHG